MAKVNQHRKRWPGFYKAFEHAVTWWFYHKAWWDRFRWKNPQRFLDAWYRSFRVLVQNWPGRGEVGAVRHQSSIMESPNG